MTHAESWTEQRTWCLRKWNPRKPGHLEVRSVVSATWRLIDYPGKNTGVGGCALLQGPFLTQGSKLCFLHFLHWQVGSSSLAPPGKPQKKNNQHWLCNPVDTDSGCTWNSGSLAAMIMTVFYHRSRTMCAVIFFSRWKRMLFKSTWTTVPAHSLPPTQHS